MGVLWNRKPQQIINHECATASVNYTDESATPQFSGSKFALSRKHTSEPAIRICICTSAVEWRTRKGRTRFLNKSNKYRRYYVKKNKYVCWRCTNKGWKVRIETRDRTVVEEFGFHCQVAKMLIASATVLVYELFLASCSICAFVSIHLRFRHVFICVFMCN